MQDKQEPQTDLNTWIKQLFGDSDLLRMGHSQRVDDMNLGLGWLYYSLARIVRPEKIVVIGSYRGFVPLVLGRALADNLEAGEVIFIDPSLADDFWKDADAVQAHFRQFGLHNVRHYCMTTQEFVTTNDYRELDEIGILFVDGLHSAEQAEFDYNAFEKLLAPRGMVFFHDSIVVRDDKVYGADKAYEMGVKHFIDQLKGNQNLQVFDVPFGATGVTLVRKLDWDATREPHEWIEQPN